MPSQRPSIYSGPGLIDLQLNGYAGFDFNSNPAGWTSNDLHRVRDALRRRGVIAAFPTLITDAVENILSRARQYAELVESDAQLETAFPRLHIEGPCISPEDGPRGAHPLAHCLSPVDMPDLVGRLQDASGGRIGILTIAPERPGALEMIRQAASQSICVAIGHTNATAEEIDRAIEAGARMSTHLGNGSHQMLPRLDNYVQTQLAEDRLWASFIADGHHMPFPT
ncbi:N-acetylglucosamine-6-phosphate deacetylase, partial [bacterium]|nr:N-acetylglucosamine-6-phosphate deacetylase [bacterium]